MEGGCCEREQDCIERELEAADRCVIACIYARFMLKYPSTPRALEPGGCSAVGGSSPAGYTFLPCAIPRHKNQAYKYVVPPA